MQMHNPQSDRYFPSFRSHILRVLATRRPGLRAFTQGQTVDGRREYFYFLDHNGWLYLADTRMKNFTSRYKDEAFLDFFFARLSENNTGRHHDYPYVSPCGRELNFFKCDDTPIVFHSIVEGLCVVCCLLLLFAIPHGRL